jgi:hypothetical protein
MINAVSARIAKLEHLLRPMCCAPGRNQTYDLHIRLSAVALWSDLPCPLADVLPAPTGGRWHRATSSDRGFIASTSNVMDEPPHDQTSTALKRICRTYDRQIRSGP